MSVATAQVKTLPAKEYHADHSHVSNSMLKVFAESRRMYHGLFVEGSIKPSPSTKVMDTGTVGHAAILEPHIIDGVCLEIPADKLNGEGHRKGKAWIEFAADNSDRILLTRDELGHVNRMFCSVYENDIARRLLKAPGQTEASVFWECNDTGLLRKMRADRLIDGWIIDVKTSNDVSPHWFSQYAARFKYYRQGPYYQDGGESVQGERPRFVLIAVQSTPPYTCLPYTLNESAEALGRQENGAALEQLAACIESDNWREPGETRITELDLPRWAYTSSDWEI